MPLASSPSRTNVADRLTTVAARMPDSVAIATPGNGDVAGKHAYATCTFRELEADSQALARGLFDLGVRPGQRLVLLVKPGIEFVKLVFALLRTGAVTVLVDPGMGRKHLVNCLAAAEPAGFIAISPAQAVRVVLQRRFPNAKLNVTVGRRWFWGGLNYRQLLARGRGSHTKLPDTNANDAAAIIFTSGSTGPPKGVLYTHQMFDAQVSEIERQYGIVPGGADLACFALFGLFNSAMGVTTVFPRMDFSRPAAADPKRLLAAANDWQVSQAFASPAVWDRLSRHCEATGERIPTLRNVFSCGAPVPAAVLKRTLAMVHLEASMHTPYGATESLPVATIEAAEVLGETAERTRTGAGVCVGRKFDTIDWRVIRISDDRSRRSPTPKSCRSAKSANSSSAARKSRPRTWSPCSPWLRQGVALRHQTTQRPKLRRITPGRSPGLQCTTLLAKSPTAKPSGIASATSAISTTRVASGTADANRSEWRRAKARYSPNAEEVFSVFRESTEGALVGNRTARERRRRLSSLSH
jgi:acyl-CoA synthetase (AMP-forming)/AMP-acid ligase II